MQTNKHSTYTLLVASVSNQRLRNCGFIYCRTKLLGICCTRCEITPSYHRKKQLDFTVSAFTIFKNVKSSTAFSFPRINLLSIQFIYLRIILQ
jgi:hypothetical protein